MWTCCVCNANNWNTVGLSRMELLLIPRSRIPCLWVRWSAIGDRWSAIGDWWSVIGDRGEWPLNVEWTKLLLHKNACKERCLLSIVLAGLFFKTPVTLTKREKGTIPQDSSKEFPALHAHACPSSPVGNSHLHFTLLTKIHRWTSFRLFFDTGVVISNASLYVYTLSVTGQKEGSSS